MKTKTLLLAWLLLCLCQFAQAQRPDSAFYRHSIGITVNPLYDEAFTSKHPVAFGLHYRLHYKQDKAIRIGGSGAYESRSYLTTHEDDPVPQDSVFNSFLLELSFGHEWESRLNKLFTLGYGTDVTPYLVRQHNEVDNLLFGENAIINEQYKVKFNTTGISLQPFLNIKLKLSQRFYLIAECKASLNYSKEKYSASGTYGDVSEQPEMRGILYGGAERTQTNMRLLPLSSLQLNIRL